MTNEGDARASVAGASVTSKGRAGTSATGCGSIVPCKHGAADNCSDAFTKSEAGATFARHHCTLLVSDVDDEA